jgi:hypothetical protein
MTEQEVTLEIFQYSRNGEITINLVYNKTGEIRQKKVSVQWLVDRVFLYERNTWNEKLVVTDAYGLDSIHPCTHALRQKIKEELEQIITELL